MHQNDLFLREGYQEKNKSLLKNRSTISMVLYTVIARERDKKKSSAMDNIEQRISYYSTEGTNSAPVIKAQDY